MENTIRNSGHIYVSHCTSTAVLTQNKDHIILYSFLL